MNKPFPRYFFKKPKLTAIKFMSNSDNINKRENILNIFNLLLHHPNTPNYLYYRK
jgi:hypothetical protein